MSIFLNWNDIDDDDQLNEAKEQLKIEFTEIEANDKLTIHEKNDEKFLVKQCVIRCYSAKPHYNFD